MSDVKREGDLSVTRWVSELSSGDASAADLLWKFLSKRLLSVARSEVKRTPNGSYDEDDVAQSAFNALCSALRDGQYSELADRDELWRLMAVIAVNKARSKAAREKSIRRGGKLNRVDKSSECLYSLEDREFPVEDELIVREECERLLELLQRDEVKQVAVLKIGGYNDSEIAEQVGCSRRSVQRRLSLIRSIWSEQME